MNIIFIVLIFFNDYNRKCNKNSSDNLKEISLS